MSSGLSPAANRDVHLITRLNWPSRQCKRTHAEAEQMQTNEGSENKLKCQESEHQLKRAG